MKAKISKKAEEHEGDDDTSGSWSAWNGPKSLEEILEELEIRQRFDIHPDCSIVDKARIPGIVLAVRGDLP